MTTFDRLIDSAHQTGAPVGFEVDGHLLAGIWVGSDLYWVFDGVPVTPDDARSFVESIA